MSWKARLSNTSFQPPGRPPAPRPPRGIKIPELAQEERDACQAGPSGSTTAATPAASGTGRRRSSNLSVRKRPSASSVVAQTPRPPPPGIRGTNLSRSRRETPGPTSQNVSRLISRPSGARPRTIAAGPSGTPYPRTVQSTPVTSVAVRNRIQHRNANLLTAKPITGPAGSSNSPRQIIIPPNTIDESIETVVDVPGVAGQLHQRLVIDPGAIHEDRTTVFVIPPAQEVTPPFQCRRQVDLEERAAAAAAAAAAAVEEADRAALDAERERVRRAKLMVAEYFAGREDPEIRNLRHNLLLEADPHFNIGPPGVVSDDEAQRAEELWNISFPDVSDVDETTTCPIDTSSTSHSSGRSRVPASTSAGPRITMTSISGAGAMVPSPNFSYVDYTNLSDVAPPEELFEEEMAPEPEIDIFGPLEPQEIVVTTPQRLHYRHGPRNPDDLMWEWQSPPRVVRTAPPVSQSPEPYSAELFRLVRFP